MHFKFLFSKNYITSTLLFILFGFVLFFIEPLSTKIVSYAIGFDFYYSDPMPFLYLVHILLGVVALGTLKGLELQSVSAEKKKTLSNLFAIRMLVTFLLGWGFYLWLVIRNMNAIGSLYELEDNLFLYYLTDISLIIGFVFGGLPLRNKEI